MAYIDIFYDLGIGFSSGFLGKTGDTLTNYLKFNDAKMIHTNSSNIEYITEMTADNKLTISHKAGDNTITLLATYDFNNIDYNKTLKVNNHEVWTKETLERPVSLNINNKFDSLNIEEGLDKGLVFGDSKVSYLDSDKNLILRTNELRFGEETTTDLNELFGIRTDSAEKKIIIGTPASTYFTGTSSKYDALFDKFEDITFDASNVIANNNLNSKTIISKESIGLEESNTNVEYKDNLFHISPMFYTANDLPTKLINKVKAHVPLLALYRIESDDLVKDIGNQIKALIYKDLNDSYLCIGDGTVDVDLNRPILSNGTNLIYRLNDEYDNIFTIIDNKITNIDKTKITKITLDDITIDNILDTTIHDGITYKFIFGDELKNHKNLTTDSQIASKGTIAFGTTLDTKDNEKQIHLDVDNGYVFANRFFTENGSRVVTETMIGDLMESSGLNNLARVAKTGSYNDLKDIPEFIGISYERE